MTALGEAALKRDGDAERAQVLVDEALGILDGKDDPVARFDALTARAQIGGWHGNMDDVVLYMERAYALAIDADRKDLQTIAAQVLAEARNGFALLELEILERLVSFYRDRGRADDAAVYEARLAELVPSAPTRTARIA